MEANFTKLKEYNVVGTNGKILHKKWVMKLSKIYHVEHSMKESLLDSLLKFTLSRFEGSINAPCSPKLIVFFQTLHAISPKFYRILSQNFGGYNERTIRKFQVEMTPEVPIINCTEAAIKQRSKDWICQLKGEKNEKRIIASAMVDTTKVPALGKFSQRYHALVSCQ